MPQTILIYGTPSLLTQKLHSILSRRHAVYSVQDEAALFAYSAQSSSGTVIFTDAICGELLSMRLITCGWKLIFLESVFDVRNSAITVGWHLYYDQLYGFSGYDPTTDIPVRAALDEIVHPILVDDIAFLVAGSIPISGRCFLQGGDAMPCREFLARLAPYSRPVQHLPQGRLLPPSALSPAAPDAISGSPAPRISASAAPFAPSISSAPHTPAPSGSPASCISASAAPSASGTSTCVSSSVFSPAPHTPTFSFSAADSLTLPHDFAAGAAAMAHQMRCAVNLVYKLPCDAPLPCGTVAAFRRNLGAAAALALPIFLQKALDYICPIPNSGIPYAEGLAEATGIPLVHAIHKTSPRRSFFTEDNAARLDFLKSSMQINAELIRGAHICLVDEAIFTGVTVELLCKLLRQQGAAELTVLLPTPVCAVQCPYCSIPTRPTMPELVPVSQIASALGADRVLFQDKQRFAQLIADTGMTCCECFK